MEHSNQWHGIALDKQVQPALSNPVIVQGEQLAMWRSATPEPDAVQVWEDRCPHRGMRLSFGYVRDNVLHCIYHSWGFDVHGQCVDIPAHPGVAPPKSICAKPYPTLCRYGIVWTNLERTVPAPLPDFACPQDGWEPVRSLYVKTSVARLTHALTAFNFGAPAQLVRQQDSGMLWTLENGLDLMIALQTVADKHTGLHMTARQQNNANSKNNTTPTRLALAKRLQRLRLAVELNA